jgi:hypothetical protein
VAIDSYSGKAGVIYWICTTFKLDRNLVKDDKRVDLICSKILEKYEDGRITTIQDDEMFELVSKYMPELASKNGR